MHKDHIVCDLCHQDTTVIAQPPALEVMTPQSAQAVHICFDCFKRPIGDLAEKVRGLDTAYEKRMRASYGDGGLSPTPYPVPYPPR
jgi:hypothetical protein